MIGLSRRHTLALGVGALGISPAAWAAEPLPELKILVAAAPGGGWDQTARVMQQVMTAERLARSAQVINVPGAGGTIGLAQFVNGYNGDPSGLIITGFVMVGAILMNRSPVTLAQVTPIARLTGEWLAFVVAANSPIRTVDDLARAVKVDVSRVTWGGGSAGGVDHITAAMFAGRAGADGSKVNYVAHAGGGEALAAILSGRVTVGISGISEFEQHVRSRRLRWIGITAPRGTAGLPGPTFVDQGFELEIQNWRGIFAGPNISPAQREQITALVKRMVATRSWRDAIAQKGWDDTYLEGDGFDAFVKGEMVRVQGVLRELGLVQA